jgi:polyphosphate kinase
MPQRSSQPRKPNPALTPPPLPGAPGAAEPDRFFHRDLSWLEFNRRVLAQAASEAMPLLERVRFLAIFTSNLDEFFMKRVGLIQRQVHAGVATPSPDGRSPREQLEEIREGVARLTAERDTIYRAQLSPALERAGVFQLRFEDLSPRERDHVRGWFLSHLFPSLTPLAVNPTHKFPFISNLSENIGVLLHAPTGAHGQGQQSAKPAGPQREQEPVFARVKIPPTTRQYLRIDRAGEHAHAAFLLPVSEIVRAFLPELFPGVAVRNHFSFRVTRSAGIQKDDLDTANLLQSIEADLKQRRFARVVRLEIDQGTSPHILRWLLDKLNVDPQDVYERPRGIDFAGMHEIADIDRPELRHKPWRPVIPPRIAQAVSREKLPANLFAAIRRDDVLVHHPYESFHASVERFIAAACGDPDVLAIKQTLYRTTPDSPFVENLVRAAEQGKQVACLVELRARFDEDRNVRFARQLEKAGVHVAYGVMGLKTHCKISLVVRKERQGLRCYGHIGTGNYHPKTAQLYTDLGLLTADPKITGDMVRVFNFLTGVSAAPRCEELLVAPFTMRQRIAAMIEREIDSARKGRPARIWAKLNALEDREITQHLYAASRAGVQVRLVVRGFCCLVPGVPGLSEHIAVSSVVGRFLEHSRIYHFAGGSDDPADGDWYLSSADWMYRNLSNRVEVAVPVHESENRRRLANLFDVHFRDGVNAWDLRPDGSYVQRKPDPRAQAGSPEAAGTFEVLMRESL